MMRHLCFFILPTWVLLSQLVTVRNEYQCSKNRQIFMEKTGTIQHGDGKYDNNIHCEWLIQGKHIIVMSFLLHFTRSRSLLKYFSNFLFIQQSKEILIVISCYLNFFDFYSFFYYLYT